VVGSFVFFILCLVADFHEISNRFFKFLWDGSDLKLSSDDTLKTTGKLNLTITYSDFCMTLSTQERRFLA